MTITKDMAIGEVVNKYPEAATVMLKYGLHCVGCAVNPFESIESGCLGHGMDEKTISSLVTELNDFAKEEKPKNKNGITLTDFAHKKFVQFMKEEKKWDWGVRLNAIINEGGIIEYGMDFALRPEASEEIIENHGIKFFVERDIINVIDGIEIDYINDESGQGFKIEKTKDSAGGCGTGCGCH